MSLLGMVAIQFALQGKIPLYPEMEKNQSCQWSENSKYVHVCQDDTIETICFTKETV